MTDYVMPQTLTDGWNEYFGEDAVKHLEYVQKLGNLAPIDYNSDMSNNEYDIKRKWFHTSNYAYITDLYNIQKWGINKIKKRGERFASECFKIWNLPQEYQNNIIEAQ